MTMLEKRSQLGRRAFLRLAAGASATAALVACAAPMEAPADGAGEAADMEQIDVGFAWWTGGEQANALFEEAVDRFEAAFPQYHVIRDSVPYGEFHTKILTGYAGGDAPDCHGVPWGTVWSMAHKGVLLDMNGLVEGDPDIDWEGMWPAVTDGCYYPPGTIISLPRESFGLRLYFYNKTIYGEAGIDTPDVAMDAGDWNAGDWTWDTWREQAGQLTQFDENGRRTVMGSNQSADYWNLHTVIPSFGHSMFNEDVTHFNLDAEAVVAWLEMLPVMINEERSLGKPDETADFDWASNGKQAIIRSSTWSIPNYRSSWEDIDWDFVPPPRGSHGHSNFVGNDYHSINGTGTANVDAAWELLKFINSPGEDLWWAQNFFGAPFRKENVEPWANSLNEILPRNGWKYMLDMTNTATPWTPVPFQEELNTIHSNEIGQAILGERPVQEVVDSITSKIDAMIADFE